MTSTSGSSARSPYEGWARTGADGLEYSRAKARADSSERDPTATSTLSGTSARSRAKLWAILPVARMPQRTGDTEDT